MMNKISPPFPSSKSLSIVMACFNEVETIESTLKEWLEVLPAEAEECELIVVNDGSTDGTGRILDRLRKELKSLRVIHQLNTGHGASIKRGCELAKGMYLLQVDPNGRYEPKDFLKMWSMRADYHLILGQRDPGFGGILEQLFTPVMRTLAHYLFGASPKDPNVPFRLVRREVLRPYLAALPNEFECVNLCVALQIKRDHPEQVGEVPISLRRISGGKERVSLLGQLDQGMSLLTEMVRLRFSGFKYGNRRLNPASRSLELTP